MLVIGSDKTGKGKEVIIPEHFLRKGTFCCTSKVRIAKFTYNPDKQKEINPILPEQQMLWGQKNIFLLLQHQLIKIQYIHQTDERIFPLNAGIVIGKIQLT